jgi:succinyl-diaminopimelate desuccinylase
MVNRLLARYPEPAEEVWRTTVGLSRLQTPNQAVNQVPASAEAWLDIRFPAEDTDLNDRSPEEITKYLLSFAEPGINVELTQLDPPHRANRDRPEVRRLQRAARAEGYPGNFLRKHGAADGRFYCQRGIDAVIFGIGGAGQHGPEEYADITTIEPYRRALTTFLTGLAEAEPVD